MFSHWIKQSKSGGAVNFVSGATKDNAAEEKAPKVTESFNNENAYLRIPFRFFYGIQHESEAPLKGLNNDYRTFAKAHDAQDGDVSMRAYVDYLKVQHNKQTDKEAINARLASKFSKSSSDIMSDYIADNIPAA